uniref:Kinesin-like protein n=1 Tax=Heterorhabditis bacteriophora TaxID=37862 RepID=A0A1I7WJU1_HETBA
MDFTDAYRTIRRCPQKCPFQSFNLPGLLLLFVVPNPKKPSDDKWFSFDHSYWSHDGFIENGGHLVADSVKYVDQDILTHQKRVFNDLGRSVLTNAWAGYNCSLFAYGQTGSGKSYTIVRDLLSSQEPPKGGLKIREHPKMGFYVENLSSVPVNSYKEIEAKISEGTKNRTIAATNMNATSSRAHTIVKIHFNQKREKSSGGTTTKKSEINLVDLAGSERQRDARTEGDRLKEGIVINQSLTTLGRVMKALHEQQNNRGKKTQIPYRDSVLTCLLKNALGGNSKTIMADDVGDNTHKKE